MGQHEYQESPMDLSGDLEHVVTFCVIPCAACAFAHDCSISSTRGAQPLGFLFGPDNYDRRRLCIPAKHTHASTLTPRLRRRGLAISTRFPVGNREHHRKHIGMKDPTGPEPNPILHPTSQAMDHRAKIKAKSSSRRRHRPSCHLHGWRSGGFLPSRSGCAVRRSS